MPSNTPETQALEPMTTEDVENIVATMESNSFLIVREFAAHLRAALTPSALSGDAGEGEPFPGCYADLQQRRVTTLAKLGLMLSVMAGGDAPEVVGYDAADLYAEVLMALAIEDADDTDIALEDARDHPDGDILASLSTTPATAMDDRIGKDAVREAVADLLAHRVGDVPGQGWLRDNDQSRAALAKLAALTDTKGDRPMGDR